MGTLGTATPDFFMFGCAAARLPALDLYRQTDNIERRDVELRHLCYFIILQITNTVAYLQQKPHKKLGLWLSS